VRRLGQPASVLPGAGAPAPPTVGRARHAWLLGGKDSRMRRYALSLALPVSGGWLDRVGGEQRGHGGLGFRGGGQDGGQPGDGG
jgi:hypothetical protein